MSVPSVPQAQSSSCQNEHLYIVQKKITRELPEQKAFCQRNYNLIYSLVYHIKRYGNAAFGETKNQMKVWVTIWWRSWSHSQHDPHWPIHHHLTIIYLGRGRERKGDRERGKERTNQTTRAARSVLPYVKLKELQSDGRHGNIVKRPSPWPPIIIHVTSKHQSKTRFHHQISIWTSLFVREFIGKRENLTPNSSCALKLALWQYTWKGDL